MSLTASPWHPGFIHTNTLSVFAIPGEALCSLLRPEPASPLTLLLIFAENLDLILLLLHDANQYISCKG